MKRLGNETSVSTCAQLYSSSSWSLLRSATPNVRIFSSCFSSSRASHSGFKSSKCTCHDTDRVGKISSKKSSAFLKVRQKKQLSNEHSNRKSTIAYFILGYGQQNGFYVRCAQFTQSYNIIHTFVYKVSTSISL